MNNTDFYPTNINQYFEWIENNISENSELHKAAHSYLESQRNLKNDTEDNRPFLSVLTRTQGRRPDMLTETLLSLTGQSNTDFEVMLMCHNLDEAQKKSVDSIVNDLPDWMRQKVRIIPVTGGTRTTPLSVGFESARGMYVSILDDDDIVFDNWVETFYKIHQRDPGKMLHSYTVQQEWETLPGTNIPRTAGAPKKIYCRKFNLLDQLINNYCPTLSLAFPTYLYKDLGIRFDESLTTTEDWDFVMRCAFIAGVSDEEVVTSVYRMWINAENSQTVHDKSEWNKNFDKIIDRFMKTPVVFPPKDIKRCIGLLPHSRGLASDVVLNDTELFFDGGEGISSSNTIKLSYADENEWLFCAKDLDSYGRIKTLRFDPFVEGSVSVLNLKIKLVTADGETIDYDMDSVETNGHKYDKKISFLLSDPQVIMRFGSPKNIKEIYIDYKIEKGLSDETINHIIKKKRSIVSRGIGFSRRVLRRLLRK